MRAGSSRCPCRGSGRKSDAQGLFRVEVLNQDGTPHADFSRERCAPLRGDSTLQAVTWQGGPDLAALRGKPLRFRFHLQNGSLFSFWVSPDENGASRGFVAAGGPGFTGATDTQGRAALAAGLEGRR